MKIALIGMGDIATKAYLPILSKLVNIELVLCSRNEANLIALCKIYKIASFCTDYRSLKDHQLDAVMIHTSSESHFEIAQYMLSLGLAVFVDKPGAMNYADFEVIANLAVQKSLPLFVGFNRRYIPIWDEPIHNACLSSIRWTKNRYDLTATANNFIFNDFIHVIDGLNINGNISPLNLHVQSIKKQNQLSTLNIQWQQDNCIFNASMNREFGKTNETLEINLLNESYFFNSFTSGEKYSHEKTERLGSPSWSESLHTKGFHHMLMDWISSIDLGKNNSLNLQRSINTHLICDYLVHQVEGA
jgi:virulence factor